MNLIPNANQLTLDFKVVNLKFASSSRFLKLEKNDLNIYPDDQAIEVRDGIFFLCKN